MAEPTTNVRHTVKAAFVHLLRQQPDLADVQVEHGWPGDLLEADSIFVAGCSGDTQVPTSKAGRRMRQDDFTMYVVVQSGTTEGLEPDEVEAKAALLLGAVDDVLAENPTLSTDGGTTPCPGLQSFGDSMSIDGPNTYRTTKGCISFYILEISASTRYQ